MKEPQIKKNFSIGAQGVRMIDIHEHIELDTQRFGEIRMIIEHGGHTQSSMSNVPVVVVGSGESEEQKGEHKITEKRVSCCRRKQWVGQKPA